MGWRARSLARARKDGSVRPFACIPIHTQLGKSYSIKRGACWGMEWNGIEYEGGPGRGGGRGGAGQLGGRGKF